LEIQKSTAGRGRKKSRKDDDDNDSDNELIQGDTYLSTEDAIQHAKK
jgi:hypothetical protein